MNGKYLYLKKITTNTGTSKYFHLLSVEQASLGLFLCDGGIQIFFLKDVPNQ